MHQLTVAQGDLAGNVDEVASDNVGHVVGGSGRGLGERDLERCHALLRVDNRDCRLLHPHAVGPRSPGCGTGRIARTGGVGGGDGALGARARALLLWGRAEREVETEGEGKGEEGGASQEGGYEGEEAEEKEKELGRGHTGARARDKDLVPRGRWRMARHAGGSKHRSKAPDRRKSVHALRMCAGSGLHKSLHRVPARTSARRAARAAVRAHVIRAPGGGPRRTMRATRAWAACTIQS